MAKGRSGRGALFRLLWGRRAIEANSAIPCCDCEMLQTCEKNHCWNTLMPDIARTASQMISGMTPVLQPGIFVFITTTDRDLVAELFSEAISIFREDEGVSMLIPIELAKESRLNVDQPMRCITLNVYSSLEGVGLTAAVSSALGDNEIPCNMVAAFHHDHVFLPSGLCDRAMEVLTSLQHEAAKQCG
jgi:hypothetical protein